ncbi:co-chaperone YbbN [Parashewanella spongiae]|uniref:Co-chaperone YbbN n=1 Tax=Parashewanella spongiae TaxID=342950 RepID=A0A3A6TTF6_9GAMM|nr:tetratricopeptide repeat protein [Parashewanella spongiae]MCL1076754.1 tetratricopeptide repeat protein [Parashewanella spongiae]RJY19494.1 co-chaperone YbbN [Parashewanella spongiae]
MTNVLDLTKENIQQVVDASMDHIVVLTFASQQMPESAAFTGQLEQLAAKNSDRFILAKVDCDSQVEIAQYFQIQSVPTTLILSKGQPVDGFSDVKPEAEVLALLEKHLPAAWELQLKQAQVILANEQRTADDLVKASELLTLAHRESPVAEVTTALADVSLMLNDVTRAEALLKTIGLADQDSYYQSLMAKLALAKDASDTPEIRSLQSQFDAAPDDLQVLIDLAKAMHQVQRNEEALELLFTVLSKDLSALDGEVKKAFMEILTALGQSNSLTNQYRRRLYTLLY